MLNIKNFDGSVPSPSERVRVRTFFAFIFCLLPFFSFSQNTTFSPDEKKKEVVKPEVKDNRKILVIPFEPKLYMSEIDHNVNKETKMNQAQIRHAFRSGLDFMVVAEFRKKFNVTSLMNDTSAFTKEQQYIYQSIGYKYDLVPASDGKTQKDNTADKPKIQNGQLTVATNDQKKFMNTKITNPTLLLTLNKKYGSEIFIFINQLDLKLDIDNSGKTASGSSERIIGVHYSIYDLQGNLLAAGLATKNFPSNTNDPRKIVNGYFNSIAQTILNNYIAAITPKTEKDKGELKGPAPEKK